MPKYKADSTAYDSANFGYDYGMSRTPKRLPFPARAEEAIADVLARRVRVLSIDQIGRTWCFRAADPGTRARVLVGRLDKKRSAAKLPLRSLPKLAHRFEAVPEYPIGRA